MSSENLEDCEDCCILVGVVEDLKPPKRNAGGWA